MFWVLSATATTFTFSGELPNTGQGGWAFGLSDANHDGRTDVLVTGRPDFGGPSFFLASGSSFDFIETPLTGLTTTRLQYERGAFITDFDNDGLRDLMLAGQSEIAIYRHYLGPFGSIYGLSSGPDFLLAKTPPSPSVPPDPNEAPAPDADFFVSSLNSEGIVPFDIDGDGDLDLEIAWETSQLFDPLGTFLFETDTAVLSTESPLTEDFVVIEDFDGDGFLDRAQGMNGPDVFWGTSTGWVEAAVPFDFQAQPRKGGVLACDFNADGRLDLFRTVWPDNFQDVPAPLSTAAHQIWLNTSTGWVSAGHVPVRSDTPTWSSACGDVDNDGDLDLIIGYPDDEGGTVVAGFDVFRNDSTGVFTLGSGGVDFPGVVTAVGLADLDRDGALDIVAQGDGPNARIFENNLQSDAYMSVELLTNVGSCTQPIYRDDVHGQVRVSAIAPSYTTPAQVLAGAQGTGNGPSNPIHIGLGPLDPTEELRVLVRPGNRVGDAYQYGLEVAYLRPVDNIRNHHVIHTDDLDGDGIPNDVEGFLDVDGDGRPNASDVDSDGNGVLDIDESLGGCSPFDFDFDGTADFVDLDNDNDGVNDVLDCDPFDASVLERTWYPDIDLDGSGDEFAAGVTTCTAPAGSWVQNNDDCADDDPAIGPGALEMCDGVDTDCDGSADDGAVDAISVFIDNDLDGFGDLATVACEGPGLVLTDGDCDDANADVYPGNPEVCDGLDNDCNDLVDIEDPGLMDTSVIWFADVDGDGFGAGDPVDSCSPPFDGAVMNDEDCDDADPMISPLATEIPDNAIDEDCDGIAQTSDADQDGDGLADSEESTTGCDVDGRSSLSDPDSDGDGVLDGAEPNEAARCSDGNIDEFPDPPSPNYGCSTTTTLPGWAVLLMGFGWRRRRTEVS